MINLNIKKIIASFMLTLNVMPMISAMDLNEKTSQFVKQSRYYKQVESGKKAESISSTEAKHNKISNTQFRNIHQLAQGILKLRPQSSINYGIVASDIYKIIGGMESDGTVKPFYEMYLLTAEVLHLLCKYYPGKTKFNIGQLNEPFKEKDFISFNELKAYLLKTIHTVTLEVL